MKNKNNLKNGFISLFFILGISLTFLTWISLSSERVFEYINIKNDFIENRLILNENILCADAFINNIIQAKYNINFINNEYIFYRNLYYKDNYLCKVYSIRLYFENESIKGIFFIIDDFAYEYIFEKGFVKFIKSFNLI